jgi:hypothetical protein
MPEALGLIPAFKRKRKKKKKKRLKSYKLIPSNISFLLKYFIILESAFILRRTLNRGGG